MAKPKRGDKNVHHIIGQCHRDEFNVGDPTNKIVVDIRRHDLFNCLFHNNQSPRDQLKVMRNERWYKVLGTKSQELFNQLLSMPDEDFYKKELVKKDRVYSEPSIKGDANIFLT